MFNVCSSKQYAYIVYGPRLVLVLAFIIYCIFKPDYFRQISHYLKIVS